MATVWKNFALGGVGEGPKSSKNSNQVGYPPDPVRQLGDHKTQEVDDKQHPLKHEKDTWCFPSPFTWFFSIAARTPQTAGSDPKVANNDDDQVSDTSDDSSQSIEARLRDKHDIASVWVREIIEINTRLESVIMSRPQLIFVDGTFAELALGMAKIVQVEEQVKPLLEKNENEEALQAIVKASIHLNSIPEKDFNPSYNLLIHLVLDSKDPKKYLPTLCSNLLKPITSSPLHHITLAANALTTIFNLLETDNPLRYNVFMQMSRFIKQNSQYELFKPMLKNLPRWVKDWDIDEEDQRKLYVEIAEIASEGGDDVYVTCDSNQMP